MEHCCIIGGAGFIGYEVVDKLSAVRKRITLLDRNPNPPKTLPKGTRYVPGDFGNKTLLKDVLRDVDEVIHLAYSSVPKTSFEDPIMDIQQNLLPTVRLFEIAITIGIKKFVLVSSGGTIYGKAKSIPIREDHPTNPISPYGITKLAIEKYGIMFYESYGLPIICVRPANAYGERQIPFTAQGFIATAIASILEGKEILIFGKSGTIRDYIYVSDVANGIIAALLHGKPNSSYNIGTGIGRSNKEVVDQLYSFAKSLKLKPRIKILPLRPFDVPVNILDSTKIQKETGWKILTSFDEGIERTWKWFYENHS